MQEATPLATYYHSLMINHHMLREIAKFLAGMVAGKIFTILWLSWYGLMPLLLIGTPFGMDSVAPALIFNAALLSLLVYYGWHLKSPVHSPSERKLLLVAGTIFLLVSALHFTRIMFGWSAVLGDFEIPQWLSWFGLLLAVYLSYASFHFALRMKGAKR
jgi:hypothetical protein